MARHPTEYDQAIMNLPRNATKDDVHAAIAGVRAGFGLPAAFGWYRRTERTKWHLCHRSNGMISSVCGQLLVTAPEADVLTFAWSDNRCRTCSKMS